MDLGEEEESIPDLTLDREVTSRKTVTFTLDNENEDREKDDSLHQSSADDINMTDPSLNESVESDSVRGSNQKQADVGTDIENANADLEKDETYKEQRMECENEEQTGNYKLPPGFLQRSPSHITVRRLTSSQGRFNTYPNLHQEFQKEKEKLKKPPLETHMSAPATLSKSSTPSKRIIDDVLEGIGETSSLAKNDNQDVDNFSEGKFYDACDSLNFHSEDEFHDASDSLNFHKDIPEVKTPKEENTGIIKNSLCMECVKPIVVLSRNDIRLGDHISFPGAIYDHHAIVVSVLTGNTSTEYEDDTICVKIVHATNTSAKATLASLHPFGNKARLREVEETIDFKTKKVMVYKYSTNIKTFPPNEIISRAKLEAKADFEGGERKFKYNVFKNNCEHFATWCVTGRKLSLQARKVAMVFWMFLGSGFNGISNECKRNEKEYEYEMLCDACYNRNKVLLDIPQKEILEINDVNPGDIITYSYYNLWHAAVVLEIKDTADNYVICDIAHYAFCGLFNHRTIIRELLTIPLNGSVRVACYPETFNVYKPAEVVERATKRLGEQQFAFFSNDSSQFARWCKLKLTKQTSE